MVLALFQTMELIFRANAWKVLQVFRLLQNQGFAEQ